MDLIYEYFFKVLTFAPSRDIMMLFNRKSSSHPLVNRLRKFAVLSQ